MNLDKLFQDGLLVDLDIGRWSGRVGTDEEALGFTRGEAPAIFTSLGQTALVPAEALKPFLTREAQARYLLDRAAVPVAFPIGKARFVTKAALAGLTEALTRLQEEYGSEAEAFVSQLDAYQAAMQPDFEDAAIAAYKRLPDPKEEWGYFLDRYLASLAAAYPKRERLRRRFYLTWTVYRVALNSVQELQAAEAKALLAQTEGRIGDFLEEVISGLRQEVGNLCQKVAEQVVSGKAVTEATLESIRRAVERFRLLNFAGDLEVEQRLADLTVYLDGLPAKAVRISSSVKEQFLVKLEAVRSVVTDDVEEVLGTYLRRMEV